MDNYQDLLVFATEINKNLIIKLSEDGIVTTLAGNNLLSKYLPLETGSDLIEKLPQTLKELFLSKLQSNSNKGDKTEFTFNYQNGNEVEHFKAYLGKVENGHMLIIEHTEDDLEMEKELLRSEAKFRIFLESASQGILVVNMHGRITLVNTQIEKLFGYPREELLNELIEILIPSSHREVHVRHRNQYILNPLNKDMAGMREVEGRKKDGTHLPLEINLSSAEMLDGIYTIAFITDISERKKLQNKIRRMERLEAVGQLAGGIAHDFNNVLAGVIGMTELAIRKLESNSPAHKNLNLVIDKAQGAAELVKQLLAFSKQQVLSSQPLNFNEILKKNKKLLQRYLREDIQLKFKLGRNLKYVNADASAIDQIITNLCINARDAMPDGGELLIQTQNVDLTFEDIAVSQLPENKNYVKVSITDTGVGMRQDVQKHIFEPFYSTKEFGSGTGLGLATVYGLVEQHNGFIHFTSALGDGTNFLLYFPAISIQKTRSAPKKKKVDIRGGNETILIIDDEPDIINSSSATLKYHGYKVLTATNGVKGLKVFEKNKDNIDLIISDVIMPKMGGVELKLLIEGIKPGIKFLHMSAYTDKMDINETYLPKPFLAEELLRRIRDMLDSYKS